MREIKFRAWDGKNRWFNSFTVSAYGKINKNEPAREWHSWKNEDWILMQFTGLKDKHGEEIYEGDIITGKAGLADKPFFAAVTWDQEEIVGYRCKFVRDGLSYNYYLCGWYEYEILGNIYQNPELLAKINDPTI